MLEFIDSDLYFVQDKNYFKNPLLQVGSGSSSLKFCFFCGISDRFYLQPKVGDSAITAPTERNFFLLFPVIWSETSQLTGRNYIRTSVRYI